MTPPALGRSLPGSPGFSDPWAWLVCAACAALGLLLHFAPPRLPFAPDATAQHMGIWLCMALLLGLWMRRAQPPLFAPLLVLLVMGLFGLAPVAELLSGAASDAVLWALGVLALSVAARDSGLLGWLVARAVRSLQHPRPLLRLPAVCWLVPAFALLPSPGQARAWARIFEELPAGTPQARRDIASAAQLCARLAWLPAHPANLLALALLPASGLDRFAPLHWLAHTWPLALLTLAYAVCMQWLAPRSATAPSTMPPPASAADRAALRGMAGIALAAVGLVLLQPFHGFAPGLMTLPSLAALFALQVLTPRNLQTGVDWPLFVSLMVLPGLVASFASALPQALPWGEGAAVPLALLLGLRLLAPAHVTIVCALVLALPWAASHRYSLLDVAVPALAGFHLAEFLLQRHTGATGRLRRVLAVLRSPVTWLGCAAYALWCSRW